MLGMGTVPGACAKPNIWHYIASTHINPYFQNSNNLNQLYSYKINIPNLYRAIYAGRHAVTLVLMHIKGRPGPRIEGITQHMYIHTQVHTAIYFTSI